MAEEQRLRVIIVGGGVAGLTLASALEQAGVDYVLLERRADFAPQVGASIGVFPNGARILDQLGAWEGVASGFRRLNWQYNQDSRGRMLGPPNNQNEIGRVRSGYAVYWGDRQVLLDELYKNLRDPSKALGSKEVVAVEYGNDSVTVRCSDQSTFTGHILVGADGVFSKTREQMWQLAEATQPALVKADRNCLTAEYNCLFGVVQDLPRLEPGNFVQVFCPGRCVLVIVGEGGRMWYFVQEQLDKAYRVGDIPRYSTADTEAFVQRNADVPLRGGLTLANLWEHTVAARLVPVEEGKFKLWTWGRIACLGDSVHKATPNLGSGGNAAIESAAALANEMKLLADSCRAEKQLPTEAQIRTHLERYQRQRQLRAEAVVDASGRLTRIHNLRGPAQVFFVRYILPYFGEFLAEMIGYMMIGAVKLDYLPVTPPSLRGTRPFNPSQGYGRHESRLWRAMLALPFLALAGLAYWAMNIEESLPFSTKVLKSGHFELPSGLPVPIIRQFYGLKPLDDFLALVNIYFMPSLFGTDPESRRQVIIFLLDGTVSLSIMMFESIRRANFLTVIQLPFAFLLAAQVFSFGVTAPIYCFLHYTLSPVELFSATDLRLTRRNWTPAVLPVVLLCFALPVVVMYYWPDFHVRQVVLFIWQLYPLWAALTFRLLAAFFPDTTEQDKIADPKADLPTMRVAVGACTALAGAVWLLSRSFGSFGLAQLFVPAALAPRTLLPDFAAFARTFLQLDYAFAFGAQLLWLVYLLADLRAAGMLQGRPGLGGAVVDSLLVLVATVVLLVAVGPGATLGLFWLWREDIITNRRHKDALTEESIARNGGVNGATESQDGLKLGSASR